eukprot:RCo003132
MAEESSVAVLPSDLWGALFTRLHPVELVQVGVLLCAELRGPRLADVVREELRSRLLPQQFGCHGVIYGCAVSPCDCVAVGFDYGQAAVWRLAAGQELLRLSHHTGRVCSMQFSPDGSHLLSGSGDHTAILCDSLSGSVVMTYKGHTSWVRGVAFSRAKAQCVLATASYDCTARVWPFMGEQALVVLRGHGGGLTSVDLSGGE